MTKDSFHFLFLPVDGHQGGRNPFFGVLILFDRHSWDDIHAWSSVVINVGSKMLVIQTISNEAHEISGRPWRFAQESGYIPQAGNDLYLDGFMENGELKVSVLRDLTIDQIIMLRSEVGHPS